MYDPNMVYSIRFTPNVKKRRILNVSFDLNVVRERLMEYIGEHAISNRF